MFHVSKTYIEDGFTMIGDDVKSFDNEVDAKEFCDEINKDSEVEHCVNELF